MKCRPGLSNDSILRLHEDVAADHYDRGIKYNPFQKLWHSRRFKEVLSEADPIRGPFLDIGCHSGTFTKKIAAKIGSRKVYGIDISPSAIALAEKRMPGGYFQIGDAHQLPFRDNFFQAVFCLEMLEHVEDPELVLKGIKRVLRPKGYAAVLVPTDNLLFKIVWFFWNLIFPVWKHVHIQSFQGESLEKIAKGLGFRVLTSKTFNLGMLKLVILKK